MTEPHREFADELLAQEKGVSEERYAEHRRRLALALAAESRARPATWARRLSSRGVALVALTAAAVLVAFVLTRPGPPRDNPAPGECDGILVVRPLLIRDHLPPAPFALEGRADVIAVAAVGEPFTCGADRGVRLHVVETLKGDPVEKQAVGWCDTAPARGSRVLLFLAQQGGRGPWGLALEELPPERERERLAAVRRYLEVARAGQSSEPVAAWAQCLSPKAGGLDAIACHVLSERPDANAGDALLAELEAVRSALTDPASMYVCGGGDRHLVTLHKLAPLLAKIHEHRAARPLIECAARVQRGGAGPLYLALPELCRGADDATRTAARHALAGAIRTLPAGDDDFRAAVASLAKLADRAALDVLLEAQGSRPVTAANGQVLEALRAAAATLGPELRAAVHDSWLQLLGGYAVAPALHGAERELARAAASALRDAELAATQRRDLRALAERSDAWLRESLTDRGGR